MDPRNLPYHLAFLSSVSVRLREERRTRRQQGTFDQDGDVGGQQGNDDHDGDVDGQQGNVADGDVDGQQGNVDNGNVDGQQGNVDDGGVDGQQGNVDDWNLDPGNVDEAEAVAMAIAFMRALVKVTEVANLCFSSRINGGDGLSSPAAMILQELMPLFGDNTLRHPWDERIGMWRGLYHILDILNGAIHTHRHDVYEFYKLWRHWTWLLISAPGPGAPSTHESPCQTPCQRLGWDMLQWVIVFSAGHRPPPRAYQVKGAGSTFVNGLYMYAGRLTLDGYAILEEPSCDFYRDILGFRGIVQGLSESLFPARAVYRKIAKVDDDEVSRTLTLHRPYNGTMGTWCLSGTDEQRQPGDPLGITFYQHSGLRVRDPGWYTRIGWYSCIDDHPLCSQLPPTNSSWSPANLVDGGGEGPSPSLVMDGAMVPFGQEFNTLEHKLADWMLEKSVLTMVLKLEVRKQNYLPQMMRCVAIMFDSDNNMGTQFIIELARWRVSREEEVARWRLSHAGRAGGVTNPGSARSAALHG